MKVALTGPVQLELIAPYFARAGDGVAAPGEVPDVIYDVTSHERLLAEETPGFYDPRMEKLAGCPYSLVGIEAIVEEFGWFIASRTTPARLSSNSRSIAVQPPKILAVDADNTLWHGILSEDGPDALVLCEEFLKGLKALADDGVVLVLLSKNDPGSIAKLACRESSFSILHSLFAASRVNWEPKAGNLIEVCRELNLGLDSVVFVDDNPHERAQMKAHLPEVVVAPWNGWKGNGELGMGNREWGIGNGESVRQEKQLVRRLREYFFADVGKTEEDRLRAADYRRRIVDASSLPRNKDEYLGSLGLWVEARPAEARDLDRLAQMAGKTNQFNCTTIRRSREEFENLVEAGTGCGTARVFIFRAGDKFGEQGIVGYVIIDKDGRRISDFVISCRAMGRTLECFMYEWVSRRVGCRPSVDFVPTAKNAPAAEFVGNVAKGVGMKTYFEEIGNGKEG